METKLLEIRDSGTFMPCLAIKLSFKTEPERWLLARAGFNPIERIMEGTTNGFILFHPLCTDQMNYDPYHWNRGARTVPIAHKFIDEHWEELNSGDVVDVQFILGETTEKKISERTEVYP